MNVATAVTLGALALVVGLIVLNSRRRTRAKTGSDGMAADFAGSGDHVFHGHGHAAGSYDASSHGSSSGAGGGSSDGGGGGGDSGGGDGGGGGGD